VSKVVIFGGGKYAAVARTYFADDSAHQPVAFTVDRAHLTEPRKQGLPVVPFEDVERLYPPTDFAMFVAVGYQDLNRLRAEKCAHCRAKGYSLVSYVSSRASVAPNAQVGENCLVLEGAVVQPFSVIGNDVFLWAGNLVGHHAVIGDHVYVAGNVVIAGGTTVEPYCFLGVGAILGHEITVGSESFLGAGALITKSVEPRSVHLTADTPRYRLDSAAFLRLSKAPGARR
jgi:sugar O-acyltransferase (sialic acid O-acetyltransferase NeuD family)